MKNVSIAKLIDQSKFELVGGIWTDKDGKIHHVGLINVEGYICVDFPKQGVFDAVQVGVSRSTQP